MLHAFDNDIDARSNDNSAYAREGAQSSATRPTKTGMLSSGPGQPGPGGRRIFEMPSDQGGDPGGASFDHLAERNQPMGSSYGRPQ